MCAGHARQRVVPDERLLARALRSALMRSKARRSSLVAATATTAAEAGMYLAACADGATRATRRSLEVGAGISCRVVETSRATGLLTGFVPPVAEATTPVEISMNAIERGCNALLKDARRGDDPLYIGGTFL